MRTRRLLTTLACSVVLAGAGAETAFADSTPTTQPTTTSPTTAPPPPPSAPTSSSTAPSAVPSPVASRPTTPSAPGAMPPPPSLAGGRQIPAVPSGAPNTGVPTVRSDHQNETAVVGGSLVLLVGGTGTLVLRRRRKAQG
ncbi:sortase-dependent protein [Catenulispora subtropica]|uniref:sortase-dependent protein n=1 Tax=Catenulispora subtropica TaxID=450798 RepID=UPI0031CE20E8